MPYITVYDPDEGSLNARLYTLGQKLEAAGWPTDGWHRRAALLRSLERRLTQLADTNQRLDVVALIDLVATHDDTRLEGFEVVETIARHQRLRPCRRAILTYHLNAWVLSEAARCRAAGVIDMQWLEDAAPHEVQGAIRDLVGLRSPIDPSHPTVPSWPRADVVPSMAEADRRFRARFEAWSGARADNYTYELVSLIAEDAQQRGLAPSDAGDPFELHDASRKLKERLSAHFGVPATAVPALCRDFLGLGLRRPRRVALRHKPRLDVLATWARNRAILANAYFDEASLELLRALDLPQATARNQQAARRQVEDLVAQAQEACQRDRTLADALVDAGVAMPDGLGNEVRRILYILTEAGEDLRYGEMLRAEATTLDGRDAARARHVAELCGA